MEAGARDLVAFRDRELVSLEHRRQELEGLDPRQGLAEAVSAACKTMGGGGWCNSVPVSYGIQLKMNMSKRTVHKVKEK